jgi:hypothetical protein
MSKKRSSIGTIHRKMFGPLAVSLRYNFIRIDEAWTFNDEKFFPDGNGSSDSVSVFLGGSFVQWNSKDMADILNSAVASASVSSPYDTTFWGWGVSTSGWEYIYVVSGHVPNSVFLAGSGIDAQIDTGSVS